MSQLKLGRVLVCDLDESLVRINTFPAFTRSALWALLTRGKLRIAARLLCAGAGRRAGYVRHAAFKAEVARASLFQRLGLSVGPL
jgi:hypothetical protein